MKLLIVLPHLRGGGAQRVAVNLINYLDRHISITLFLINDDGFMIDYIEKDIQIITSKAKKTRNTILELKKVIDQNKYDAVFTMKNYLGVVVSIAVSLTKFKPPIIYREVTHKSETDSYEIANLIKRKIWYRFDKYVYHKASKIIVPSDSMKHDLAINYLIPQKKIIVINNPVDLDLIEKLAYNAVDHPWFKANIPLIIGMGRLTKQKGFQDLIKAVSIVAEKNIQLRLVIIGDGDEKSKLQKLVEELAMQDKVAFLGSQANPYKYISKADIFVLSSLYEGFPNALIEAMTCGTPVISTDCKSGPSEIIDHYENGILVPVGDARPMAEEIDYLLSDPNLASALALKAKQTVINKFAVKQLVAEYEKVFQMVST